MMQTLAEHLTEQWRGRELVAPRAVTGPARPTLSTVNGRITAVRIESGVDKDFVVIDLDSGVTYPIADLASDQFGLEPFGYTEPAGDAGRDFNHAISYLTAAQLLNLQPRLRCGQHRRFLDAALTEALAGASAPAAISPDSPEIIVAEVSKSWRDTPDSHALAQTMDVISKQFETVIAVNRERGYRLHQWQFRSASYPDADGEPVMTETIVATFEKVNHGN